MLAEVKSNAEQKMQKNFEGFNKDLAKIRTDRAHPNLLENVLVEYYDQRTALFKMATRKIIISLIAGDKELRLRMAVSRASQPRAISGAFKSI